MSTILEGSADKIARFNAIGLDYNIVAARVYDERRATPNPFGRLFLTYVIAALNAFDMLRQMGTRDRAYSFDDGDFGARLESKLVRLRGVLEPMMGGDITSVDLSRHGQAIRASYDELAGNGAGALHSQGHHFHVGATKVLHFLNPELFIIVDSNASRAFREAHSVPYRNTTQPGYTAERYVQCMRCAQTDISEYEVARFQRLEPGTPLCRIYDKLTFMTGST